MLDSALLFIVGSSPKDGLKQVEEIFRAHVNSYSTGYLLLPDGVQDPEQYCESKNTPNLKVFRLQKSADLDNKLQMINMTEKVIVIIAVEIEVDEELSNYIECQLDESLVTPSALYLNGTLSHVNRAKCWRMFKHLGRLTRNGSDEDIIQWGHLLNELSFCLGHSPKYGD